MGRVGRISKLFVALGVMLSIVPVQSVSADDAVSVQAITTPAVVAPSSESLVATVPDIVMTAFSTGDRLDVAEFYNQSSTVLWLGDVSVVTLNSAGQLQSIPLQGGFLLAKHYVTFAANTKLILGALQFGVVQQPTSGSIIKLTVQRAKSATQSVNVPQSTGNLLAKDNYLWAQHKQRGNTTVKQTGEFATDFVRKTTPLVVEGTELYVPAQSAGGLRIAEIHANPIDCEPSAASVLNLACSDYVKVVNDSASPVNLTNYRLRVGAYGDSAGIASAFNWHQSTLTPEDEYVLNPHESFVVHLRDDLKPLALAATGKYVWIEDYFGTTTYSSVQYPDMTLAKYNGSSWAYDATDATWKAGVPSPQSVDNVFPLAPSVNSPTETSADTIHTACGANQYRSPETNRCRSLIITTPTPCKEGQYRSEETNRCRSIVQTVAASLKPCSEDQFRNPATGRCKKIASAEDIVQPCDSGWERNVATNRCRKIKATSMPVAAFPVESIAPTSSHIAMMLGGGGVLTGALGYAAWEWRRELVAAVQRLTIRR